ncbi:tRNA (adenosine(37)-N6)-threonylcarbamoyltransferase complex dimerization subunit type 1 TsaB [Blattabacterium cuenoti]|uniref:tRNA (adenosine(37)-N6)-threonylcarbamoyltransferase complex dimerization subunit type 1 TsaB n=1 Tax=Blattabacterium cuenoti TaxID=1653831 RepID=UPI00163C7CC5|nr:tRNA (adenosine(37)-N6)-threonylcarbamoyltransferase complex dimerization subunit type 1 TsaB [Blattabacterium cuenoti]
MSLILNLETSTKNCSISIAKNGICIASIEECSEGYLHSEKLHMFIQYAMKIAKIDFKDLKSICVSKGPGSYTSLRIGASAAKGLCLSLGIPLLSIDSLTILVHKFNNIKSGIFIPMIHAKSDLFYTSLFNEYKKRLSPIFIKKFNDNFFKTFSKKKDKKVYFLGNFIADKFLSVKNNKLFFQTYPSSMDMSEISYVKYCNKEFNNIEKFLPFYL